MQRCHVKKIHLPKELMMHLEENKNKYFKQTAYRPCCVYLILSFFTCRYILCGRHVDLNTTYSMGQIKGLNSIFRNSLTSDKRIDFYFQPLSCDHEEII